MNNETNPAEQAPGGRMLFFRQPELLNHQVHGTLGLRRPERPYDFARRARALPVTLTEIPSAQKHFPIIFSDLEKPVPLAVVGSTDDVNLFVDDDGQWEPGTYVPAYARCYPFALAARPDDQFAVVIDRAADSVSEDPEQPFFEGEQVTAETQSLIDFCGRFDAERKAAADFGQRLKELELLVGQQIARTAPDGESEPVAGFVAVDARKLGELDDGVVTELFGKGQLAAIFGHLFSLENWQRLMARHARREGNGASRDA